MKLILKSTIRNFLRKPIVNTINLFGLSVSLALVFIISVYCYRELTTDKFHKNGDQIYLYHYDRAYSEGLLKDLIELEIPSVESVVRLTNSSESKLLAGEKSINSKIIYADQGFFNLFDYKTIEGNLKTSLEEPYSIVLKKSLSYKLFGNESAVGKTVELKNGIKFKVTAVIEDFKANSCLSFNAISTISTYSKARSNDRWLTDWGYKGFITFLQIERGFEPEDVLLNIKKLIPEKQKSDYKDAKLTQLSDIYFSEIISSSILRSGDKKKLQLYIFAAALIVLVALINFINIASSNWFQKIQQFGIIKVVGARRKTIFFNIAIEVFIILFIAMVLAIFWIILLTPFINNYTGIYVNKPLLFSPSFIVMVLIFAYLFSLLFSLVPASQISKSKVIYNLKNRVGQYSPKFSLNSFLVTVQFLIAIVLIAFTVLVKKQINYSCSNLGFNQENIVGIELTKTLQGKKDIIINTLNNYPNIGYHSFTTYKPGMNIGGITMDSILSVNLISADDTFFDLMGIKLIEGNFYDSNLSTDLGKSVVNNTFLTENKIDDPIGFSYRMTDYRYVVVGIIEDFHYTSFHTPLDPLQVVNTGKASYCYFKMQTDNFKGMKNTLDNIKNSLSEISPDEPVNLFFMDDAVQAMYLKDTQFYYAFSLFAICAIVICSLGILAMSLFACQRRIKEIGIRKVNGAKVSEILAMLNKDFIKWVGIAFVVATPIAYYAMQKWLENFAYKTGLSWWIFVLAGLLALVIALLTVSWQSWKAATRNPVEALRYE